MFVAGIAMAMDLSLIIQKQKATKMQTFLPYPDFRTSLDCLDNKRLGKQRVEAMQLINALEKRQADPNGKPPPWFNHPAAQMWLGSIPALKLYHDISIRVWKDRGFKNTMKEYDEYCGQFPWWIGNPAFHASHRSNLLRKDPVHYGQFGWTEPHDLPYVWPSKGAA